MTEPCIVGSVLYGADELVMQKVAAALPEMRGRVAGPYTALGVVRSGVLLGGTVWHNYIGHNIEVSIAFDRADWARPSTLRRLFAYPFIQLEVARITAVVAKRNARCRKLTVGLGFKLEGTIRKGFDGKQDAMIYGLLRDECRFLPSIKD